jgi:hypothetical protein
VHGINSSILRVNKQIYEEASGILYGRNTFGFRKWPDGYKIASLSTQIAKESPDWSFQNAGDVLFKSLNPKNVAMMRSVCFFISSSKDFVRLSPASDTENIKLCLEDF